jgi:uncharacterized protein (TIGR02118 family)
MIKRCSFVRRKRALSKEEFSAHWLGVHAELAQGLPGLRKYVINVITDPPEAVYDGFAELWFDSDRALSEALESPAGQALRADMANFVDEIQSASVNEHAIELRSDADRSG